ncbi:MAG TPA: cytochrome c3 family protein [Gemmatimonadaceae bacterium]
MAFPRLQRCIDAPRARRIALLVASLLCVLLVAAPVAVRAQAPRKACIDCHQDFKKRLKEKFVHAPVTKACEECHLRHGFAQKLVLKKDLPGLCVDCHKDVGTEMASPNVHGALKEGGCYVCHDSHAADNPQLLRKTEKGKSVCLTCHESLGATMANANAHDPFKKGNCTVCHKPHASDRPALAVASDEQMCAPCHKNILDKHKKVTGAAEQECTACHDPHLASGKMKLAANAHPPFAEGDCASCHEVENGEVEIGDDFPAKDLCSTCHEDVAAKVAGNESHFGADAMKSGGTETCLKCHNPHHSREKGLLAKTQNDLCRSCHEKLPQKADFQKADAKGAMHPPFAEGNCTTCHDPHGGGGAHHLAQASSAKLCGSCHQAITAADKPGEVHHAAMEDANCLDCHGGHASEHGALLKKDEGQVCADCHEKQSFANGHPPYLTSKCGVCHANHSRKPKLFAKDAKTACGTCHPEQLSLAGGARFPHPPAKDEDCLSCHKGHGSAHKGLLTESQKELCTGCHDTADLAKKTTREAGEPVKLHAPVMEGNCSGCHDAHGSNVPGLVKRERADLCYGCHTQQKISFTEGTPHDPVLKGSCDVCHTPHGSTGTGLRLKSEPELCTQCHDFKKPPLDKAHKGINVAESKCTSCHAPHNSKQKNLLNPVVHSPFAEGDCESCHEGGKDANGKMSAVAADACMTCHDDMQTKTGHQHAKGVTCVNCHQPHSSKEPHLINNVGRLCQSCHADVVQAGASDASVHRHPPVAQGRCLDCHQMHEPAAPKHLARAAKQLCSQCHSDIAARSSDKTQHDPFKKGNCSACHEVHVSESANLLKKSEGGLCKSCHGLTSPRMTSAHKVVPLTGANSCTTCHDPHSTKQAASRLVYPVKHDPYKDKDCSACHAADGKPAATVAACAECHEGKGNAHNAGRKGDAAHSIGVCMDCHSPHAGFDKLMMRPTQTQTCMQCHDRREFSRKNVHAALEDGCTTCHDVHDQKGLALKGEAINAKCSECHDAEKTHAHKTGGPAKDPRTGEVLNCVSCHEPHSSGFEHLTRFDEKRDLCVQCHASGMMD